MATMRLVRRGELHFNEDGDPFVGRADIASLIAALAGGPDISLEGTLTIEFEIEPVNDTGFSGTLSGAFGGPVQKARAPRAQIS